METGYRQNVAKNVPFYGVDLSASYYHETPSIVDGMMRGLGGLPVFDPNGAPWEICIFFKPLSDKGLQYVISEETDSYNTNQFFVANSFDGAKRIGVRFYDCNNKIRTEMFCVVHNENIQAGEIGAFKLSYDLKSYEFCVLKSGKWTVAGKKAISYDVRAMKLCLCYQSGGGYQLDGEIDLNRSYITIGNKIWWEGVPGARRAANLTFEKAHSA